MAVWAKERLSGDGVGLSICINSLRLTVVRRQCSIPNSQTSQTPFQQPQKNPNDLLLFVLPRALRSHDWSKKVKKTGSPYGTTRAYSTEQMLELVTERMDGKCRHSSERRQLLTLNFYHTITKESTPLRRLGYFAGTGV